MGKEQRAVCSGDLVVGGGGRGVGCLVDCDKQTQSMLERLVSYVVGYRSGEAQAIAISEAQHFL